MIDKVWSKDDIIDLLKSNDHAVERALLFVWQRQTLDEQATNDTRHRNSVGFSSAHARQGSRLARWVARGNKLTGVHLVLGRKIALRYTRQLLERANSG